MIRKSVCKLFILGALFTACDNSDNLEITVPPGEYQNGILVSNEGPFNNGTGTVSFISEDLMDQEAAIFNKVNGADLGNIVQSIGFTDDKAYIVANVSNTITVVDRFSFERDTVITSGLNNPRYVAVVNGKGYVTNWGDPTDETDDYLAVIDLTTNTVDGQIAVDFGPEEMVATGTTLYVAHQGGFGQNNKISVIDTNTDAVSTTITVGDVPNAMVLDNSGDLWVLSGGKPAFSGEETAGVLSKINTASNEVTDTFEYFEVTEHPNHLGIEGDRLYYSLNGAILSISIMEPTLPVESDFEELSAYAMAIRDGRLYTTDPKDFASNGSITIHDLSTKEAIGTFEVGIIPGGIYFN